MILHGFKVVSSKKLYCNSIDSENIPKCADTFDLGGNHLQYVYEVILTGTEEWFFDDKTRCYYFHAFNKYFDDVDGGTMDTMMSTHFVWVSGGCPLNHGEFAGGHTDEIIFNYNNGQASLDVFVNWVKCQAKAGTPIKVYYILKEPIYHGKLSHYRTTLITMKELMESKQRMELREK